MEVGSSVGRQKVSGLSEFSVEGLKVGAFSASGIAETTEPKWRIAFNGQVIGGA